MGITPVFGVSEADRSAPYTEGREVVVLGPARASESYLDMNRVVQAALQSECTAIHPGWGFLSENAVFAALAESHGITFLGPPAHVMSLMGKKTPAKKAMAAAGLELIPGSDGVLSGAEEAEHVAKEVGFPVLLKAESGGGGRGMRIARSAGQVAQAFLEAQAEARAAFGDDRVYLEKLIERGRHVEIQLIADKYGNVAHVGERDCTVQRNHQKLIEESPAPVLKAEERARTLEAAVRAARAIGYVGAGTMEFLLDATGKLRFMEMNTRLQVEHSVSEMRSELDLVRLQIEIGAGRGLPFSEVELRGCAIECRINAEDPANEFRPAPGVIQTWVLPSEERVRVDTHVRSGYEVPPFYDSLIAKVIAHGDDRDDACERMIRALEQLVCEGIPTTIPMHLAILRSREFRENAYDNRGIPGWPPKE
jgi:acetyl-CoA carboxylase biotin carboxylase subunit